MSFLFDQLSPYFIEGAESCMSGFQRFQNPYSSDTQEAFDWDRGFMSTLEQAFILDLFKAKDLA